jgi:site-specific DNA-cytosine methylase
MSKRKAVNAFIFAGSFSIGVMKAGFDLEKVLEISDDILEKNAYYFQKNYPNIPVVLPKEWEDDKYLEALSKEDIDLMCCNCPCSSLSQINRNASVEGKNNVHFYRLFNVFEKARPKVFVIENAPTLVKLGFPILKDLAQKLSGSYYITIVRDEAGNHNVPMKRTRTLAFGWRKDYFSKHPVVKMDKQKPVTIGAALSDILEDKTDDCKSKQYDCISRLYKYARDDYAVMTSIALAYIEGSESMKREIRSEMSATNCEHALDRIIRKLKSNEAIFDKSPYRGKLDERFQSFSSVQEYMHPTQPRTLNMRELKRIMTYPDGFDFTGVCKVPMRQAMAQGVPVNFGKYVAEQAMLGLDGKLECIEAEIVFQDHLKSKYETFSLDEFCKLDGLEIVSSKSSELLS